MIPRVREGECWNKKEINLKTLGQGRFWEEMKCEIEIITLGEDGSTCIFPDWIVAHQVRSAYL